MRRDDVGYLGSIHEGAMNTLLRQKLLAQHRNVVIRRDQGIQRVDTIPWVTTGVSTLATELAMDVLACIHQCTRNAVGRLLVGEQLLWPRVTENRVSMMKNHSIISMSDGWKFIRHKRDVDILVGSCINEHSLATAILLCGGAQQLCSPGNAKLLQYERQSQEGSNTTGCNEVMSAGVSNT